jgi:hypothetical protein
LRAAKNLVVLGRRVKMEDGIDDRKRAYPPVKLRNTYPSDAVVVSVCKS